MNCLQILFCCSVYMLGFLFEYSISVSLPFSLPLAFFFWTWYILGGFSAPRERSDTLERPRSLSCYHVAYLLWEYLAPRFMESKIVYDRGKYSTILGFYILVICLFD